MSRTSVRVAVVVGLVVVVAAVLAAVVFLGNGGDGDTGGPAELPAADSTEGGVPTDAPSEDASTTAESDPAIVDPTLTVSDPVPDGVLGVLFDLLEADGTSPLMDETYNVEFVETTDKVHISGEFEDGSHDFNFEFDNGVWTLQEES